MKTTIVMLLLITGIHIPDVSAQCNGKLVEQAVSMSGADAIIMREFKVKFAEGTIDKPMPVGRYNVFLNAGMHYRIVLANSVTSEGKGIVQVYDKTDMLGSTFDADTEEDLQQCDFVCEKTKAYQVLAFFREGKPGCMAAVLSVILPDSAASVQTNKTQQEILYLGIDNPLSIRTSLSKHNSLNVSISQGNIEGSSGEYIARVIRKGLAIVYVDVLDSSNRKIETDSTLFEVRALPLPVLLIGGKQGGMIGHQDIMNTRSIGLKISGIEVDDYYSVVEYTLATGRLDNIGISVHGDQLPQCDKEILLNLPAGTEFFLLNAIVKAPDGSTYRLPSQTFIIEW